MFSLFDLPFELFVIVTTILIPISVVASFKAEKQKPGNPINKMIGLTSILFVAFLLKGFIDNLSVDILITDIVNVLFAIIVVLYFIGLGVSLFLAHKRGYGDTEKLEKLKPTLKSCAIVVVICMVVVIVCLFIEQ